jgi:hypothetical protein
VEHRIAIGGVCIFLAGRISETHTLKIIVGGFLLLGLCLLLGRWIGGAAALVGVAIKCFLVLWLIATLINMWVGVSKEAIPSMMRLRLLCSYLRSPRSFQF